MAEKINQSTQSDEIQELKRQLIDAEAELYGALQPSKTGFSKLWQDIQTKYRTSAWANSAAASFLGTLTPYGLIHWSLGTKDQDPNLLMAALSVGPAAGLRALAKLTKLAKLKRLSNEISTIANGVDAVANFNPFEYAFKKGKKVLKSTKKAPITAEDLQAYKDRVYNIANEKTKILKERELWNDKITELKNLAANKETSGMVKPLMTNGQIDVRKVNDILPEYPVGVPTDLRQAISIPRAEATAAYNQAVSTYMPNPSNFQLFLRNPKAKWLIGASVLGTPAAIVAATELTKPGTFTDYSNTVEDQNQSDEDAAEYQIPRFYDTTTYY